MNTAELFPPSLPEQMSDATSQTRQVLKRFLLIFNDRIFDSMVDRGIPSLTAAPVGPATRPPVSFSAISIMSFSCSRNLRRSPTCCFDSSVRGRSWRF